MRTLLASFILASAVAGAAHAADTAGTPVTANEIRTFTPAVLPKLTPEEQAAFGKAMQEATSEEALAGILTTYAIIVQQRGVKLPHPVAAGSTPAVQAKPPAPAAGSRPVTLDEVRAFSTIIRAELDKTFKGEEFITALKQAQGADAQLAVVNRYAAMIQARGVALPHPVPADGAAPPSTVAADPDGRVPTTIDPSWTVEKDDGDRIESITKPMGRQIIRTTYDRHGFRQTEEFIPTDRSAEPSLDDPSTVRVVRTWTPNQRLQRLVIGSLTYEFPVAALPNHPLYGAKQVIIWNDPANQIKGVRSATLLPTTEPDGSTAFVGGWRAWNVRGKEIEFGQMEQGARAGAWIERTFADTSDSGDFITEAKGTYVNGKKSGTWIVKVSDEHPEVIKAVELAQKANRVLVGQSEGFRIEQIWESGTLVKETRNF